MSIFEIVQYIFSSDSAPIRDGHILWQIIEKAGVSDRYTVQVSDNKLTCKIVSIN